MKVREVHVEPQTLALRTPLRTAAGEIAERMALVIHVTTETGLVGVGEACPLPGYDDEDPDATAEALSGVVARELPGAAADPATTGRLGELPAHARAAVDCALWDLAAQREGRPLWRTLREDLSERQPDPSPVAVNALIGADDPTQAGEQAEAAVAAGFTTVKVKGGDDRDVARVRAVRDAAGPDIAIRVDANRAWSSDQAPGRLAEMGRCNVEYVEEPTADPRGWRALRGAVALAADESSSRDEAAVEPGVALPGHPDVVIVKLGRSGGFARAAALAASAPSAVVTTNLDGPVGVCAATHLALAIGDPARAHGLSTLGALEGHGPPTPLIAPPTAAGLALDATLTTLTAPPPPAR
ncbi:MAG: mandelate racemase/muconate lactonizing enzyme family protein [Solirubrobacterales bacterium]